MPQPIPGRQLSYHPARHARPRAVDRATVLRPDPPRFWAWIRCHRSHQPL